MKKKIFRDGARVTHTFDAWKLNLALAHVVMYSVCIVTQ